MHLHTCTLVQADRVELGWVGVLWLNAFPVMLHRQAPGLPLPLLALSVFAPASVSAFFHRSPHCCKGHECKCCGEGFEPHAGDEVWTPSGTLKPRRGGRDGEHLATKRWRPSNPGLNSSRTVVDNWKSSRGGIFFSWPRLSYPHCKPVK